MHASSSSRGDSSKGGNPARTLLALATVLVIVMCAAILAVLDIVPHPEADADPQTDAVAEGTPGEPGEEQAAAKKPGTPAPDVGKLPKVDAAIAAQLRGRVRLYQTKEPVEGLELTLTTADGATATVTTGKEGAFKFPSLPPGAGYSLFAERAPYAAIDRSGIDLAPEQRLDLGTLWLEVPVDVDVIVTDSRGTPLEGATVAAFSTGRGANAGQDTDWWENRDERILALTSSPKPSASAQTSSEGTAKLSGLSPGNYRLVANAPGHATASVDGLVLAPDAAREPVRLLLGQGNQLVGAVFDKDGAPVAGAKVIAVPGTTWSVGLDKWETLSGEDGAYELTGLRAGQIALYLIQEGRPLLQVGSVRIPETPRFDIRLRPTGMIRGTVTDDKGTPVADAEVRITIEATWSPMSVKTGSDGTFELLDVPAGALGYFKVSADGFVPYPDPSAPQQGSGQSLREGTEMIRDVVLRRGIDADLVVRADEDSRPVEGAEVRLLLANRWGNTTPWAAATDADGKARVSGLVPGVYLVLIRAEGYVQEDMPPWFRNTLQSEAAMPSRWRLEVDPSGDGQATEYRLARGAQVSGRVVDQHGTPIVGAEVSIPGAQPVAPVFTADGGVFTVDAVPPSKNATASAVAPGRPSGTSEPFIVPPGELVKDIEIRLGGGASITGLVRSEDGSKFEGAIVRYLAGQHDPNNQWARQQFDQAQAWPVDADGRFRIEGVPSGEEAAFITLRAEAQGFQPSWSTDVQVTGAQETGGVQLILTTPLRITGRVESQTGQPVAGALVTGQYMGDGKRQMWNGLMAGPAQTDEQGKFALEGLKSGEYWIWPAAAGYAAGSRRKVATGTGDVLLTLAKGKPIAGVVRDEANQPVAGIPVNANKTDNTGGQDWWYAGGWGQVYTAPDGSFELLDMAEGTYRLQVTAQWQWGREINVEDVVLDGISAGRTDVEITVKQGNVIEGKLVDKDGAAVRSGWLQASFQGGQDGHNWSDTRWSQVQSDGRFRLAGLRAGQYQVHAWGSFNPANKQGVAAGTKNLVIEVESGFSIAGQIVDDKGFSVDGFNVRGRKVGEEQWTWLQAVQPGDGTFVIVGLTEGSWDLQFQAQGRVPVVVPEVVVGRRDVRVVLSTGRKISGSVVDSGGSPIQNANIQATQLNVPAGGVASNGSAQSDADGWFEITGLAPGEYQLIARGNEVAPALVSPVQAGTTSAKLVLSGGTTISGKVVDGQGNPRAHNQLWLMLGETVLVWTQSDQNGAFTFNLVPEGQRWRIRSRFYDQAAQTWVTLNGTEDYDSGATDIEVKLE